MNPWRAILAALVVYEPELIVAMAAAPRAVARVTAETFRELSDYSCTVPTGVVPGKIWRRREPYRDRAGGHVHLLGSYQLDAAGDCWIRWWRLEVIEGGQRRLSRPGSKPEPRGFESPDPCMLEVPG